VFSGYAPLDEMPEGRLHDGSQAAYPA
jgi:hypothetical protein